MITATKTVGWFWVGSKKDWTEDLDELLGVVQARLPDIWTYSRHLLNTAIAFTIAHEVAHIVLGHLDGAHAKTLRVTEDGPLSHASAMDSKDYEIEADVWAAETLLGRARGNFEGQTLALSVPALVFCLSALVAEMTAPIATPIASAIRDTHPPYIERAQRLHTLARTHASEVAGSNAMKHFVELGFWVNDAWLLLMREGMHWAPAWLRSRGVEP